MTTIQTRNSSAVLVDDEDAAAVASHRWTAVSTSRSTYAMTNIGGRTVYLHRLLLGLTHGDGVRADHRDGDGLYNQRLNLRIATAHQNNANKRKQAGTSSAFKGVTLDKVTGRWKAQITCKGQNFHLGRFGTEEAAALAYHTAAVEKFGEFANTERI